jgi:hypothetical protein
VQPHLNLVRPQLSQQPKTHKLRLSVIFMVAFILGISLLRGGSHASSFISENAIRSNLGTYCLEADDNNVNLVDCSKNAGQNWAVTFDNIVSADKTCLSVGQNNSVSLASCNSSANQVWLRNKQGFINPNLHDCLSVSGSSSSYKLGVSSCNDLSSANEMWQLNSTNLNPSCIGDQAQLVACYAVKEYARWQSGDEKHETLLNFYTDGASYEEWCADFVSYVYKEAGYPFTNGNADGWDENIADNIQNMGFTLHTSPNYVPQAGDVAYFDYAGGHVEIVVSGGKTPTFVYGNSATVDPTTGNGQMETNAKTSDGNLGQVTYYMSPNSST